jgi:hypothetical protein
MGSVLAANPAIDWSGDERSWVESVSQLALGDEQALAQLYDATNRIVYGLALRVLADPGL